MRIVFFILSLLISSFLSTVDAAPKQQNQEQSNSSSKGFLRISCSDEAVGAEVNLNEKFKGNCPVDIQAPEGSYKLRIYKKLDEQYDGVMEQDIRLVEGSLQKVEVQLRKILSVRGQEIQQQKIAEEKAAKQAKLKDMLANGFQDCPNCPKMIVIKAPSGQGYLAIGQTEVTRREWNFLSDTKFANRGICPDEDCPVNQATRFGADDYIQLLRKLTGKNYRLPNADEWTYACYAGNKSTKYCGSNNFEEVSSPMSWKYYPVAKKTPNAWGLYDMTGNVAEIVEYTSSTSSYSFRRCKGSGECGPVEKRPVNKNDLVVKGGGENSKVFEPRSFDIITNGGAGFRVALTIEGPEGSVEPVDNQNNTSSQTPQATNTQTSKATIEATSKKAIVDWTNFCQAFDYSNARIQVYYSPSSISKTGDAVNIETLFDSSVPLKLPDGVFYNSIKRRSTYYCSLNKFHNKNESFYEGQMGQGKLMMQHDINEPASEFGQAEGCRVAFFKTICNGN